MKRKYKTTSAGVIQEENEVKTNITLEIGKEKCELCGKPAVDGQPCAKCGKAICSDCTRGEYGSKYCPVCFARVRNIGKLA